jgi:hypothetical protein
MLQRCTNPNRADWPRYGGRGVVVCDRWRRFENFLTDMGECPPGMWLDRIDSAGNYEPGNVRWATFEEQLLNRRRPAGELHRSAKLTVPDVLAIRTLAASGLTHRQLATLFGVSHTTVGDIVRREIWRQLVRRPRPEERAMTETGNGLERT